MPRLRPPALMTRALPATLADLQSQCIVKTQPKLIDEVVKVFFALYDDEEFRALRGEDDPEATVHGSIVVDDVVSAQMVKEKGVEMGLPLIIAANLHSIGMKLRAAERRYNASRKQRENARERPAETAQPAAEPVA